MKKSQIKQPGATDSRNRSPMAGNSSVLGQKSLQLSITQHKGCLWEANLAQDRQEGHIEILDYPSTYKLICLQKMHWAIQGCNKEPETNPTRTDAL